MTKLILDASIVISWCIELEDLIIYDGLAGLGDEFVIPERVRTEIEPGNRLYEKVLSSALAKQCDRELFEQLSARHFRLGKGELSVISLGMESEKAGRDYLCVVDDSLARSACGQHHLDYTGNIGLCRILVEENSLAFEEATSTLEKMRLGGSRIPKNHPELLCSELDEQ